jgi:hypothetical protein
MFEGTQELAGGLGIAGLELLEDEAKFGVIHREWTPGRGMEPHRSLEHACTAASPCFRRHFAIITTERG